MEQEVQVAVHILLFYFLYRPIDLLHGGAASLVGGRTCLEPWRINKF